MVGWFAEWHANWCKFLIAAWASVVLLVFFLSFPTHQPFSFFSFFVTTLLEEKCISLHYRQWSRHHSCCSKSSHRATSLFLPQVHSHGPFQFYFERIFHDSLPFCSFCSLKCDRLNLAVLAGLLCAGFCKFWAKVHDVIKTIRSSKNLQDAMRQTQVDVQFLLSSSMLIAACHIWLRLSLVLIGWWFLSLIAW